MRFCCIWYYMDHEITRDYVDAKDTEEASVKVHLKYNGADPGPCLSITPADLGNGGPLGYYSTPRW